MVTMAAGALREAWDRGVVVGEEVGVAWDGGEEGARGVAEEGGTAIRVPEVVEVRGVGG